MTLFKRTVAFFILFFFMAINITFADVQRVYDEAGLLTEEEVANLEQQAAAYFEKWDTDFIIVTTESTEGKGIRQYLQDFSDKLWGEFNREEDNMAIITVDIGDRWVDLAGFGRAEKRIDNKRADHIRQELTPYLSDENYYEAFQVFMEMADEYMRTFPGVNPNSIFFNTLFQLAVSLGLAGIIVFFMAYHSGGKVTVTSTTYLDRNQSRVIRKRDRYLRKSVTRMKKPSSNSRGGGGGGGFRGGGGGVTRAGRSHSGSRGRF